MGQERCLNVWPRQQFAAITAGLGQGGSVTRKDLRDYQRVFLSGASDDVPDKQGRVTIPPLLRSYAGLDRDLAVIGAGDRVEVWDAAAWSTYLAEQEDSFASLSEEVLAFPPQAAAETRQTVSRRTARPSPAPILTPLPRRQRRTSG